MQKKNLLTSILVFGLLLCASVHLGAQATSVPTPAEVRKVLDSYEISENEFRAAMAQRGYDLNNINLETIDLEQLEAVSMKVIAELAEKKTPTQTDTADNSATEQDAIPPDIPKQAAENIEQAIETGASPSEAVNEELQDLANEQLPDAKVFGHHLFRSKDVSVFRQVDKIKPPKNYVLGVGDELSITINGLSQESIRTAIDEDGYIAISGNPPIPVNGLTLSQAEDMLKRRLKAYYSYNDNQFYLTVLTARTVTVNFFGEVMTTGGVTVSAVNTLFNALVAAGGPTDLGSVRKIRLISGAEEKIFDTYEYMQNPAVAGEFYLENNDYVHIPVASRVVAISGAVRRPYRYELLDDEHLIKLIEYAGGVEDDAYLRDIQITRFNNDQRVVINVNLREIMNSGGDYLLEPGDEVVIQSIDREVENFVSVQGAVIKPGDYERKDGMRMSDLILAGGLDPQARTDFGYLLRRNPNGRYTYVRVNPQSALDNPGAGDDLLLSDMDILRIPSLVQYADDVAFAVAGAVRIPGSYSFDPAGVLKVQDAVLISGGLRQSASTFGYILRRLPEDPKSADYIVFNPQTALQDPGSTDNITLMPFDSVVIFDAFDLRDEFFIEVDGAVRNPGRYPYDTNITLEQAIDLAGGLTFSAASNRVDVARIIINENQATRTVTYTTTVERSLGGADSSMVLFPFDEIFVRTVPQFEFQKVVQLRGEIQYPGGYALIAENERIADVIRRAGGLTPEAFTGGAQMVRVQNGIGAVVINLSEALANPNSAANIILQAGDVIDIPKQPDLVTITGAVNLRDQYSQEFLQAGNRINVAFEKGKNAKYYVDNYAAGLAEDGRKNLITVKQANGRIEKTKSFLFFKTYPKVEKGATVHVGRVEPEPEALPSEKEDIDWGRVVSSTLAQATAILTLILLVDRL